jgi:uncharacterized protein YfaT (DUF1175 family)
MVNAKFKWKLWLPAGIIAILVVLGVGLSWKLRPGKVTKLVLSTDKPFLVADGNSTATLTLSARDEKGRETPIGSRMVSFEVSSNKGVLSLQKGQTWSSNRREVRVTLTAGLLPGEAKVIARMGGLTSDTLKVTSVPWYENRDGDGFPDAAELQTEQDKTRFREWFASIADAQYYQVSDLWQTDQQDCAGLIRFAFREALKHHDREWLLHFRFLTEPGIGEIGRFNYPDVPLLGANLFRTRPGAFQPGDLSDSTFKSFCEAKYLPAYNCTALGYDERAVRKGDLLFFFHYDDPQMPYHGIVFTGESPEGEDDWLVYHTGPVAGTKGIVKKVRLRDLKQHPEEKWRPLRSNKYFLGYYRWKIIADK